MKKLLISSLLIAFVFPCSHLTTEPQTDDFQCNQLSTANRQLATVSLEFSRLTENRPEQILFRKGYTVSYNRETKNPNWVAWHLTKEHTEGPWKKDGITYMADNDIKGPRQETEDWSRRDREIDHGHMCPAGDNKWSREAMAQTFLLTNICPQNKYLNRGGWEYLERRCRGWARHYGDIYIVTGPLYYSSKHRTMG